MTHVCFDFGGYYIYKRDDVEWKAKEKHSYTLFLHESWKKVRYSDLVEKICKKVNIKESKLLKLSYFSYGVVNPKRVTHILDDEDAAGYIWLCKTKESKSVLHVEVLEDVDQTSFSSQASKENVTVPSSGQASRVSLKNNEIEFVSDGGDNEVYMLENGESSQHCAAESSERDKDGDIVPYIRDDENCEFIVDESRYLHDYLGVDNDHHGTADVEGYEVVEVEWDDGIDLRVNQELDSKRDVQDLVDRAVHQNCFEVITSKSTTKLYVLKCRSSSCKWSIRVATIKDSNRWSVRTYNKMHTCIRLETSTSRIKKKGTSRLVASLLHEDYPGKFDTPSPKNLMDLVQGKLGCKVSYSTALRGKKLAVADVRGTPDDCYKMLPSYLYMLEKENYGTLTRLECDNKNKFKYLFFALGACIEGFQCMRKVIIVDGTFLKTVYGGVLIVATAQDPEHHHYPLAFAVVDGEKDDSWRWFLETLKTVVPDHPELVFISDRNASIIKTIGEVYPNAKHGYCTWHLSQNVKLRAHGANKSIVAKKFRECARLYTEAEFIGFYSDFRQRYPNCAEYLDDSVWENKWARCYFPGERYNVCTSNSVESINSVLKEARTYSLVPMLDAIIGKIAEWFNKYRKAAAEVPETQKLVPSVNLVMHKRCEVAKKLQVNEINSFELEYTVIGADGKPYIVKLRMKSCSCRRFDIDKYPCEHAIAAAMTHAQTADVDVHDYCSPYYYTQLWALAYYMTIYPVPHRSAWQVPDEVASICILPPDYEKKKGRNKEARFPSVGERRRKTSSTSSRNE